MKNSQIVKYDKNNYGLNNIEIEVKLEVDKEKYEEILDFLKKESIKHINKFQYDIYFSPESPSFFGGDIDDECIRIRIQKDKNILCYKKIIFGYDEADTHIVEYETQISDLESTINILKGVRINKICEVKKNRDIFVYNNIFEIALDRVENLGFFIEIEICDKTIPIKKANQLLREYIKKMGLDITKRNQKGYSNLMYERLYKRK